MKIISLEESQKREEKVMVVEEDNVPLLRLHLEICCKP
jgi:hypothetical protein